MQTPFTCLLLQYAYALSPPRRDASLVPRHTKNLRGSNRLIRPDLSPILLDYCRPMYGMSYSQNIVGFSSLTAGPVHCQL